MSDLVTNIIAPAAPEAVATPETDVESPQADNVTPDTNPDTHNMTARFAALSRKEKELREQAGRASELEGKYKEYQDLESRAKDDPLAVLSRYGIDLDTIIAASLGEEKEPLSPSQEIQALRDEMAAEKQRAMDEKESKDKEDEEAYQSSIDEAILNHQNSITDYLSQNTEKYELITLQGGNDLVWEVTEAWYEANDGEILTPEAASDKVESYLEDQVRNAMKLKRFNSTPETADSLDWESLKTEKPPTAAPTLSSDHMAPAGSRSTNMTIEESKAAAASLLKWD